MIRKEVIIGDCRLILGDCREIIGGLTFDAICTDPPYGIGAGRMRLGGCVASRMEKSAWDDKRPDLSQLLRIPGEKIIWGGNYFPGMPSSRCWLVWDKGASFDGRSFAECELAWTSLDMVVRKFTFWQVKEGIQRQHPTQKPVALMEWCLGFLPDAKTILDPFMGSGTTLVACAKLGRKGIGIELDPDYFEIACKRVRDAYAQPDLFIAPPEKPVQEVLL